MKMRSIPLNKKIANPAIPSKQLLQSRPYVDYGSKSILPHITEKYDYIVTNSLLLNKIINPRRDKVIMNSLSNTQGFNFKILKRRASGSKNRRMQYSKQKRKNKLSRSTQKTVDITVTNCDEQEETFKQAKQYRNFSYIYSKPRHSRPLTQQNGDSTFQSISCAQNSSKISTSLFNQSNSFILREKYIGKIVRNNNFLANKQSKQQQQKENMQSL